MRVLFLAIALLIALHASAQAGFVVPLLIPALVGTTLGAVISFGVNMAVGIGLNLVASKLLSKKEAPITQQKASGGVELDLRVDADVPQSFLVGRAVTAGSLVYAKTFGRRGETDNSDLIEIIALSDMRSTGLVGVFCEGGQVTLGDDDGDRGRPVDGYSGNLAIKFYDGSQTTADAFAVAALSEAAQPWTINHIGRGRSYVRAHSIYNPDTVPGRMRWRWVVDGVPLYDPRKDSTMAGGDGPHRFGDASTYEWTDNVAVISYNVLRGIYYYDGTKSEFVYGLEGTRASQLPADVWYAAMNECDVLADIGDGEAERQYRCGGEIQVDTEPLETIKELLKCCGGRLVEIGGIYKLYVGAPNAPVLSIDDGWLTANREEGFKPFLPLEARVNYVTGKYTAPEDGFIPKVAPPRGDATWEEEDGRRVSANLDAPMIQSGTQMQRVMQQLLNRAHRERKHVLPLPPICLVLEPGDVFDFTYPRRNYLAKGFEIDAVDFEENGNVLASVTEVDHDDYDPPEYLPELTSPPIVPRPAIKAIEGFAATAYSHRGDLGTRRPGIALSWVDPEDADLVGISYELRLQAAPDNKTSASVTNLGIVQTEQLRVVGGLQPLTAYQVRARYISFNGYATEWSLWLDVVTTDDRISLDDFQDELSDYVDRVLSERHDRYEEVLQRITGGLIAQDNFQAIERQQTQRLISVNREDLSASIEETLEVALGIDSSLAAYKLEAAAIFATQTALGITTTNLATLQNEFTAFAGPGGGTFATFQTYASATFAAQSALSALTATVSEHGTAIASTNSALGALETSVGISIGGLSTSVTNIMGAVGDIEGHLEAVAGLKLDVNGRISGYQFYGGSSITTLTFLADIVKFAHPSVNGGAGIDFLQIGSVDGNDALVLKGDFYGDGTIYGRSIRAGEIAVIHLDADIFTAINANITNLTAVNINSNYTIFNNATKLVSPATIEHYNAVDGYNISSEQTVKSLSYTAGSNFVYALASFVMGSGAEIHGTYGYGSAGYPLTFTVYFSALVNGTQVVKTALLTRTAPNSPPYSSPAKPSEQDGQTGEFSQLVVGASPGDTVELRITLYVRSSWNGGLSGAYYLDYVFNQANIVVFEPRGS